MPEVKGALNVTGNLTEAGQRVFSPNNLPPSIVTEDFDAISASGLYRNTTTGATGAPTASVNWLVQASISNANNATQLAIRDGRVAVRTKLGVSTYGAWRFLTDNFTDTLAGMVPASGGGVSNFLRADGTWAAPAGGGGGSLALNTTMMMVPDAGEFIGNSVTATLATSAMAAGRHQIGPFFAPYDFSIDQAGISVSTGVGVPSFAKVTVYNTDANGRPTTLRAESAGVSTEDAATVLGSITCSFEAGTLYWVGVWTQGAPTIRFCQTYASTPLTWTSAATPVRESVLRRVEAYSGVAPDWTYAASQHTGQNVPFVLMRIA